MRSMAASVGGTVASDVLEGIRPQTVESGNINENERESIAKLAHALWQSRGCPIGSPEQDWAEAERQVRVPEVSAAAAAGG